VRLGVLFQDRLKPDWCASGLRRGGGLGRVLLVSARVKWHRPPEYYSAALWRERSPRRRGRAGEQGITPSTSAVAPRAGRRVRALTATRLHAIEAEDVPSPFSSSPPGGRDAGGDTVAFPGYPRRVEISGTEGTVVVEGDRVAAADLRTPGPGLVSKGEEGGRARARPWCPTRLPPPDVRDFARAIATGAPRLRRARGLRSLAVVEAVYAAAREAGWRSHEHGRGGAPVEPPSTRDRVVEHVRRLIEKGSLTPGDRLPPSGTSRWSWG